MSTNRGVVVVFKETASTREIEEFVETVQELEAVMSIGFFPEDVDAMKERFGRITSSEGFLGRYWKRLNEKG
jgi:nitrate reductase NapAB chaperone NapD